MTNFPKVLKKNENFALTVPISTTQTAQTSQSTKLPDPTPYSYPIHFIVIDEDEQLL